MASLRAARPSFACWTVAMLSTFSSARIEVALARFFLRSPKATVSASMSSCNLSSLASRPAIFTLSASTSANRKPRSFSAFAISVSQKRFFVASAVDSRMRRSTSCWIKSFTLAKGSAEALDAIEANATLPKRRLSSRKRAAARLARAKESALTLEDLTTATFRPARDVASAPAPEARSCRNDGAKPANECSRCERPKSSARLLTATSSGVTPCLRIVRASVSALSSSARNCERWSQSFARASQRSVNSCR
mmetsp:Transcript_91677/g.258847  ORF Transcript_91677/g.258847 Transcript_91677/m.258847 type:complete len:251 (-) Transcript_91677:2-754(-)